MISKIGLKEKLINSDMFIDNIYLDKYIYLILKHINTPNQKNITQKHHILPRYYFKHRNISLDNSKENLVNLPIYDHIRAHYYLYNCAKEYPEKYSNLYALRRMLSGKFTDFKIIENLNDAECLKLYQEYIELNRKTHSGKTHVTSTETKLKIGNSNKGKCKDYKRLHNSEGVEISISESELPHYLNNGWVLGRSEKAKNNLKAGYNYESKGMLGKKQSDYQKECARKALLKKPKSASAKNNMSKARLGKKLYINPQTGKGKYIAPDEIKYYEKNGWYKK